MARKIIWTRTGRENRKLILAFWRERNKSDTYSNKLRRLFKQAIQLLQTHSDIGTSTNDKTLRVKLVESNYLIVYDTTDEAIIIHAIWDTRRNPEDFPG